MILRILYRVGQLVVASLGVVHGWLWAMQLNELLGLTYADTTGCFLFWASGALWGLFLAWLYPFDFL